MENYERILPDALHILYWNPGDVMVPTSSSLVTLEDNLSPTKLASWRLPGSRIWIDHQNHQVHYLLQNFNIL